MVGDAIFQEKFVAESERWVTWLYWPDENSLYDGEGCVIHDPFEFIWPRDYRAFIDQYNNGDFYRGGSMTFLSKIPGWYVEILVPDDYVNDKYLEER